MSLSAVLGRVYADTHFWKRVENHPSLQAENLQYPFIQAQKHIMLTHLQNKNTAKSHFKIRVKHASRWVHDERRK